MIIKKGNGIVIDIEVKPNSEKEKIDQSDCRIKVYVKAPAEKGKANFAIIKIFSKLSPCQIVSGLTSKKKRLFLQTTEEKFKDFLVSRKV